MKKNIFQKDQIEYATIFKDESIFYPSYLPEEIPARDNQIKEITFCLDPIIKNKKTQNMLLFGTPGTGKTLLSKYVVKQLTEYTQKAKCVYINAIEDNTRYAVLLKILSLFPDVLPRRGLGTDEIFGRIKENLKKQNSIPIIIIDEVDQLPPSEASYLLYELSRTVVENKYFTLLLITNNKDFLVHLDPRVQSSLFITRIEFNKYLPVELKTILRERIEYGLIENAISEDLIGYIAGYASKAGGDARIAIDLLFKAAKNAEKKGSLKITKQILLDSANVVDSIKLSEKKKTLSKLELSVLSSIIDGMQSGDLYSLFPKTQERTIRRYITSFEKQKLIETKEINTKNGRTRQIFLKFDKSLL